MKVYRMMAALLSAAMLTAAPAVYAEDAQTPATQAADGQAQTVSSEDESGAEKKERMLPGRRHCLRQMDFRLPGAVRRVQDRPTRLQIM